MAKKKAAPPALPEPEVDSELAPPELTEDEQEAVTDWD